VYLGSQHLSDVAGGWALGAAIYSLCGMVVLVGAELRGRSRERERTVRGSPASAHETLEA
jgi:hypothetical protein